MSIKVQIQSVINNYRNSTIQSEAEVRSKLIVPLLKTLGYPDNYRSEEYPVYGYDGNRKNAAKLADFLFFLNEDFAKHRNNNEDDIRWVQNNSLLVVETKRPGEMPNTSKQAQYYTAWTKAVAYITTDGERFRGSIFNYTKKDYDILECDIDQLVEEPLIEAFIFNNVRSAKEKSLKEAFVVQPISVDESREINFLDTVARYAFKKENEKNMARAILTQDVYFDKGKKGKKLPKKESLQELYELIIRSDSKYPLLIEGFPGTGKSTLISLLYLFFKKENKEDYADIIDLHKYDIISEKDAVNHLDNILRKTNSQIGKKKIYLFIDGINGYKRFHSCLEEKIRNYIYTNKDNNTHFVIAKGEIDHKQFPSFVNENPLIINADRTIKLQYLNADSTQFVFMIQAVLKNFSISKPHYKSRGESSPYDQLIGRFLNYCKLMSGNIVEYRTMVLCARVYLIYKDHLFEQKIGNVLLNYSFSKYSNLDDIAESVTDFMLSKEELPINLNSVFVFKSPVHRDFLFALHYINVVKNKNIDKLEKFNCIFTPNINRMLIDLIVKEPDLEYRIVSNIIDLYPKMAIKTKNQAVYLLGRVTSERAREKATSFLKEEYKKSIDTIDEIKTDINSIMLYRSVGISLLYLNYTDYENDFLNRLIYDDTIKKVNIRFHVIYYTTNVYKVGDELQLNNNDIYTSEKLDHLYSLLWKNINSYIDGNNTETPHDRCKQGINIITFIGLYTDWYYHGSVGTSNIDVNKTKQFSDVINSLLNGDKVFNPVVKDYLINAKAFLLSNNIYADSFSLIYKMKSIRRKGWSEEGRDIDKSVELYWQQKMNGNNEDTNPVEPLYAIESDADHTWGCCMLALMFLTENIDDCLFLSLEEKKSYKASYDLHKILKMLIIHDLPEVITGDTPVKKQNSIKKKEEESTAMNVIETLDSFPNYKMFSSITATWHAYDGKDDINSIIAYQIDKIEPLVQLFIYRNSLPTGQRIAQRNEWKDDAIRRIHSYRPNISFGDRIIDFISEYLLKDEFFMSNESES